MGCTPPDWMRRQATNKYKLSGGVVISGIEMTRSRFLLKTLKGLCHESLLLSLRQEKNKCNKFVLARAIALAQVLAVLLLP
jgi:hypothetical protein